MTQTADDLKARDALLRGFPEVESVVGKSGRADGYTVFRKEFSETLDSAADALLCRVVADGFLYTSNCAIRTSATRR